MYLKVLGLVGVVKLWHDEARMVVGIRSHKMGEIPRKREGGVAVAMAVAVAVPVEPQET